MKRNLREHLANFFFGKRGFVISLTISLFILAVFLVQMFGRANRELGYDFTSYLLSSQAFLNNSNPYQTGSHFPYIYPLFFCVILAPLLLIPYWLQNLVWYIGSSASIFFGGVILMRYYSPSLTRNNVIAVFIVPFVLLINVIQNNLLNGQVNFIVLLLCILFIKDYLLSRRFTAALFLSAAIAIKLTPLIFLVYLLFRRDFIMLGLVIFTSLILSFVVPYIIAGSVIFDYYSSYLNSFLLGNIISNGNIAHGYSFSITSIIEYFIPSIPKQFTLIIVGIASVTPIALIQLVSKNKKSDKREIIIFSVYMLAILLITPMCETHHLINLFPALFILIVTILQYPEQYLKIGLFILMFILGSLIFGKYDLAVYLIAVIALYISMFWIILQNKAADNN